MSVKCGYECGRAALQQDELVIFGNLLGESNSAVTQDAPLTVNRDQG